MMEPEPRQPEPLYWYQVGCMIGCTCSGGGKESYPSLASVNCTRPGVPTLTKASELTWNAQGKSPMGEWNKYMPWRAPGTAKPLDSCGIASGFSPDAAVQFPHSFTAAVKQGMKGTELPAGKVTVWKNDSVVKASYRLVVNHGGGYQYRVCPKTESPTESCFHANPLAFANGKTTVVYSTGKRISLNAVDVTEGVQPAGHAWRRLPIPACNCDFGTSCQTDGSSNFYKAYPTADTNKAHGHCTSGLQFQAQHISDGSWADGYGYYVSTLGTETKIKVAATNGDPCGSHKDKITCDASSENGCTWYALKSLCYSAATNGAPCGSHKDKSTCDSSSKNGCTWYALKNVCSNTQDKKATGEAVAGGVCTDIKDETACSAAYATSRCKWYSQKQVCYPEQDEEADTSRVTGFSGTGTKDAGVYQWWVEDELKAPSKPGDYIMQWRWDNEQTPQVWTTCADIMVTTSDVARASLGISSEFAGASLMLHVLLVAAAAVAW